jgi:hypothetical protein
LPADFDADFLAPPFFAADFFEPPLADFLPPFFEDFLADFFAAIFNLLRSSDFNSRQKTIK